VPRTTQDGAAAPRLPRPVFVSFDNDVEVHAPRDAQALQALLDAWRRCARDASDRGSCLWVRPGW
jgi:uncharacterized protein YecE (DUF72 family)